MEDCKTDHDFYAAHVKSLQGAVPRGATIAISHTATCRICTRRLYGADHEAWHVSQEAKRLGLTYEA